jgi:hypothetical protein
LPRISPDAIERNRVNCRERRRREPERARKTTTAWKERKFEERPFIGWDSEGYDYFITGSDGVTEIGPQRTMLFGCSVPGRYITGIDIRTKEFFDLILQVEREFPEAYHVIYSGEYDFNQFLNDLPWRMLAVLKITGRVRWNGYRIQHVPHKMFKVSKDGVSATIYDCFGFFHSKYETALDKYDVGSDNQRAKIHAGKSWRGKFNYFDLPAVTEYMLTELELLPDLLEQVRTAAYSGGFRISMWHGPGALAKYALRYNNISEYRSRNVPKYVQEAIRSAYAGGHFQAWQCGEYYGPVYTLDKNSAYVQGISLLPNLAKGKWTRRDPGAIKRRTDIARFGLYYIEFDDRESKANRALRFSKGIPERPYPLFHRDRNGKLTWPSRSNGWYWSPEAALVVESGYAKIRQAIEFADDGTYPFKWVKDSYDIRVHLQDIGNPAEKSYKWALASIYGSFAQRVGWDRKSKKPPHSHELAWAGYITSHCRAAIFEVAQLAYKRGGLISVDTDGVMATTPFQESDVPEGFGKGLGQWKQDSYTGLVYWQNGIYWLRNADGEWKEAKSRGVPKGRIPLQAALDALQDADYKSVPNRPAKIRLKKTRYVGYRQALNHQHNQWRRWIEDETEIIFGGTGKGLHVPAFCAACKGTKELHTITHLPPQQIESEPHKLPWLEAMPEDEIKDVVAREFQMRDSDVFRDEDMDDYL